MISTAYTWRWPGANWPVKTTHFLSGVMWDVGFDAAAPGHVVVPRQVEQFLARHRAVRLHTEQIDPHAVGRVRDLRQIAAVVGKERVIA